jgi:putative ABC transport system permease protein
VAIGAAKLDGLDVTVVAIQGDLRALRPFRLIAGHWLSAGDAERSPEIVLGKAAMGQIYLGSQTLSLRAAPISIGGRVVGSVDDALREPTVYVRLADLHLWTDASPGEWSLQILGHSGLGRMGETKAAMMTALGVVGLPASIPVRLDQLGATADAVATVRVAFLAVATISLLVGALGILNIGLVSLHERVEELALRRACGAIAAQIGLAILLEGVFAAVVAACFAIVGAGLLLPIVTQLLFPNYPTSEATGFPFQTAVLGMAAAALAGFFGGIVPAIRAARMQIANVMRA